MKNDLTIYRDRNGNETPISLLTDEQLKEAHLAMERKRIALHKELMRKLEELTKSIEKISTISENIYVEGAVNRGIEMPSLIDDPSYRRPDSMIWNDYMFRHSAGHRTPIERFNSLIEEFAA